MNKNVNNNYKNNNKIVKFNKFKFHNFVDVPIVCMKQWFKAFKNSISSKKYNAKEE